MDYDAIITTLESEARRHNILAELSETEVIKRDYLQNVEHLRQAAVIVGEKPKE